MRGINVEKVRVHVFEDDLKKDKDDRFIVPEEEQTEVLYSYLDAEVGWELQDRLMEYSVGKGGDGDEDEGVKSTVYHGRNEKAVLLHGVKGWRKLYDEDGNRLPDNESPDRKQKIAFLSMLSSTQRQELAAVINRASKLTDKQRGESASRPGLPSPGTASVTDRRSATAD